MSRGAPVLAAMRSKRRLPRNSSRTTSRAHFSPTTCSAVATEQGRPGVGFAPASVGVGAKPGAAEAGVSEVGVSEVTLYRLPSQTHSRYRVLHRVGFTNLALERTM